MKIPLRNSCVLLIRWFELAKYCKRLYLFLLTAEHSIPTLLYILNKMFTVVPKTRVYYE